MWDFLVRQLLRQAGRSAGGKLFNDDANGPEAYADRIMRDFHLHDYADAWVLYDSDRAYWEAYYGPPPSGLDRNRVFVRDSAAAAGVPSRNNVFEYGFPESSSSSSSSEESVPVRTFATQFARPASSIPVLPLERLQGDVGTVDATRNPPVRFLRSRYQNRLGGGMDGWRSSVDGADPLSPTQPVLPRPAQPVPSPQEPRGLPGLLLEYLRNNPDY
jgi:hypothetical protein